MIPGTQQILVALVGIINFAGPVAIIAVQGFGPIGKGNAKRHLGTAGPHHLDKVTGIKAGGGKLADAQHADELASEPGGLLSGSFDGHKVFFGLRHILPKGRRSFIGGIPMLGIPDLSPLFPVIKGRVINLFLGIKGRGAQKQGPGHPQILFHHSAAQASRNIFISS